MKRITEPELMLNDNQCREYLLSPKQKFFDAIEHYLPKQVENTIADLGCGPGDFTNFLLNIYQNVLIDAIDGSNKMIQIAQENIKNLKQVSFINSDIKDIDRGYDFVFCSNTLHHLHDPTDLWKTIQRISKNKFMIVDLIRPDSEAELEDILKLCEWFADPDSAFIQDFRNSLRAAFTVEELYDQTKKIDCKINVVDDFLVKGHKTQLAIITNYSQ